MSMDIGGMDLRFAELPRRNYSPRIILEEIVESWPDSVFEGLQDDATRPLSDMLTGEQAIDGDEFFVYRNADSARQWERKGATAKNGNDMLHFVTKGARGGRSVEITMVIGELTPEMGRLYWAIDNALSQTRGGTVTSDRARLRRKIASDLRAVGCALSPEQLRELASEVLSTLYPEWTVDELACHPHDALQFCEVVRSKAGAPVPDPLIMRALLNRHKRNHSQTE